jgi:hypothetical protein
MCFQMGKEVIGGGEAQLGRGRGPSPVEWMWRFDPAENRNFKVNVLLSWRDVLWRRGLPL